MKKVIALLLIFAMCLSFVACNGNNKSSKLCAECKNLLIGEWFSLEEKYNEDSNSFDYNLDKISITEDGKLSTDAGEFVVKFGKCNKNHNFYTSDKMENYSIDFQLYSGDSSTALLSVSYYDDGTWVGHREYYSMKQYNIVEITEENWQDYFSPDFNESFDITNSLELYKDTWGDITDGYVNRKFQLKDYEKYHYKTSLAIEYSCDFGNVYCEFDAANETVTKYDFTKTSTSEQTATTILDNSVQFSSRFGSIHLNKEAVFKGNAENSTDNPIKILRMKGWLVIRNDA